MEIANPSACPFCTQDNSNHPGQSPRHSYLRQLPVSPGHCLIIPKWHIASFFDATREEQASLLDLLAEMRQLQLNPSQPPFNKVGSLSVSDGFNIGINGGRADDHALAHL